MNETFFCFFLFKKKKSVASSTLYSVVFKMFQGGGGCSVQQFSSSRYQWNYAFYSKSVGVMF